MPDGFFFAKGAESKKITPPKIKKDTTQLSCETCGLYKKCNSPKLKPIGKGKKGILIIDDCPSSTEDKTGNRLSGDTGSALKAAFTGMDLLNDCVITNAVRCKPMNKDKVSPLQIDCCRQKLIKLINKFKPRLVIVMGSLSADAVLAHRWKKDFPPLSALRGWVVPDQDFNCWVSYTFDPYYVMTMNKKIPTILKAYLSDVTNALKHVMVDFPDNKVDIKKDILLAYEEKDIHAIINDIANDPPDLLAIDYETSGLKPYREGHFIRTVALSFFEGDKIRTAAFPLLPEARESFAENILANKNIAKVAHYMQMEETWGRVLLKTKGINWKWDTCLAAHVLDSRSKVAGLKFQAYVNFGLVDYSSHLDMYIKSEEDKDGNAFNNIGEAPLDDLLYYNGMDTINTLKLSRLQQEKIGELKKGYGYAFLHAGVLELLDVEEHGMHMNFEYCTKALQNVTKEMQKLQREIEEDPLIQTWKKKEGEKFNINSSVQLSAMLYQTLELQPKSFTKAGKPSTNKEALAGYAKKIPFLQKKQMLGRKKTIRDFLTGWVREAVDGILHPQFSLSTVETFRGSCSRPNLQNVPVRDTEMQKILRSAITASPGNQLLEADFKGVEVCVSACYHKDPIMLSYIKDKTKDMHRDMAMELFKLPSKQISKAIRHVSKNGFVFPAFYGSYYEQIAPAIWDAVFERDLTLSDGTLLIDHLKKIGLGTLTKFKDHVQKVEDSFWNTRFKVYAKWKRDKEKEYLRQGYLKTHTGFQCSGPLKKNQIVNFPIQGSAFHCLLWTLITLNKKIKKEGWKSRVCSQIHDSMVIDLVPTEKDKIIKAIKYIVNVLLPRHWDWVIVPMEVEMEIAPVDGSWYQKKEIV